MKKIVLLMLLVSSFVFANDLAKKCIGCHGSEGEKSAFGGKSKIIKDLTKTDFINALKGYQKGSYGGNSKALMKSQVIGLTDAQIFELANYFVSASENSGETKISINETKKCTTVLIETVGGLKTDLSVGNKSDIFEVYPTIDNKVLVLTVNEFANVMKKTLFNGSDILKFECK